MAAQDKEHNLIYQRACTYLSDLDDDWSLIIERIGPCELEPTITEEPYERLIRAIAQINNLLLKNWLD